MEDKDKAAIFNFVTMYYCLGHHIRVYLEEHVPRTAKREGKAAGKERAEIHNSIVHLHQGEKIRKSGGP